MSVEGSTITSRIKNLLRSPSIKLRRSKAGGRREDISTKMCSCFIQSSKAQTAPHPQQFQENHHCSCLLPRWQVPGHWREWAHACCTCVGCGRA
uniref:Mitogen-activated protein kinase binding protein 1 n=1 Tax=Vombatus ursinus TaxID=29139 RepID=A0A4X2KKN1_VOMUR